MTKLSKKPTNIVFLLPVLRILDKTSYYLDDDEIQQIILENSEYTTNDIREDDNQIKRAILYLNHVGFIKEDHHGNYQITKDGRTLFNDSKKTEEQKERVIVNKLSKDVYNIPSTDDVYSTFLIYLRDNPNHPIRRKDSIYDAIEKNTNFYNNKDVMELRSPKNRTFEGENIIYSRFNYAISDLSRVNLIEKSDNKGYQLTQKGFKILEDEENIKTNVSKLLKNTKPKSKKKKKKKQVVADIKIENNPPVSISADEVYEKLFLEVLSDRKEHKKRSIFKAIEEALIPDVEIPDNIKKAVDKNIEKVKLKLEKEDIIIQATKKGYWKLTDHGIKLLNEDNSHKVEVPIEVKKNDNINPIDTFKKSYHDIKNSFDKQLLDKITSCSPEFFENLVLDLLLKEDKIDGLKPIDGYVTPLSRDGGIDGKIYFDGLKFPMCFQAKRYQIKSNVQRPEIQSFIGALRDYENRTNEETFKGIFVTTSDFSTGAKETAKSNDIILKNGDDIVKLMKKHKVGIKKETYKVDLIDDKYFEE